MKFWCVYHKLGSLFDVTDPWAADCRYLGPRTEVDFDRLDDRMARLAAAGATAIVLDLAEGLVFRSLKGFKYPGAVTPRVLNEHVRKWEKLGLRTIPMLGFSAAHCEWMGEHSRMIGSASYYDLCRDVIRETSEIFEKPSLINIGMDDETPWMTRRLPYSVCRRGVLLWRDLGFYADEVAAVGSHPWMWGDVERTDPEGFAANVPKSYFVSARFFGNVRENFEMTDGERKWMEDYDRLEKAGFRQIPCCSTSAFFHRGKARSLETSRNPRFLLAQLKDRFGTPKYRGVCCFPFLTADEVGDRIFAKTCDALAFAKKEFEGNA